MRRAVAVLLGGALFASGAAALAHHGTAISYDQDHPWTTDATVIEFVYANPHPRLTFMRLNERGQSEAWVSELGSNPSRMARTGWTRSRANAVMAPGAKVKLTLATSKSNPRSAVVRAIQDASGKYIVMSDTPPGAVGAGGN